jgi:polyphosphate:AMP phosphotransferase
MLAQVDLSKHLSKEEYREAAAPLEIRLGQLQRRIRKAGMPIAILFEGWDAAGKGTLINRLFQAFDPRYCRVIPTNPANEEERLRPFLWRFWKQIPGRGKIAVYDRSWYWKVLNERVEHIARRREWKLAYHEITTFERQLADDGTVLIKLFLHISKKEQKRRFEKLQRKPMTQWRVTPIDWKHHFQYDDYLEAIEEMLARTDTDYAPWSIVEAENKHYATIKLYNIICTTLERRLAQAEQQLAGEDERPKTPAHAEQQAALFRSSLLEQVDLQQETSEEDYRRRIKKYQKRMFELEHEVYIRRIPVLVVFEGPDAAGKGGAIRRLTRGMDPRGYAVNTTAAPDATEFAHHYMWRFWLDFPKAGHIAIFDRSWYGRVLVERVEGFCRETEWRRAYREINENEEHMVNFGAVLVKFWIHIDKNEQLRRFESREARQDKQWKMTDEDWRNRDKWEAYERAADEMLFRTSTAEAPWTIIAGNDKYFARLQVLRTVISSIEKRL